MPGPLDGSVHWEHPTPECRPRASQGQPASTAFRVGAADSRHEESNEHVFAFTRDFRDTLTEPQSNRSSPMAASRLPSPGADEHLRRHAARRSERRTARGRIPRRRPAARRGGRRHRQDRDARPPGRVPDRTRRRPGPHPAADLHATRLERDAAPRRQPAPRERRACRPHSRPARASGAAPSTRWRRGCSACTHATSASSPTSRSWTAATPRT